MASAGGAGMVPQGLGRAELDHERDGALTFQEALLAISPMKLMGPHARPIVVNRDNGEVTVPDLPLRILSEGATMLVHAYDCIVDHTGDFDLENIEELAYQGRYRDMPVPLRLKVEPTVPYTMQIVIQKGDDAKQIILKHLYFEGARMKVPLILTFCHGQAMQVDYGRNFRDGAAALQYMLQEMGGFQVRYWHLQPKGAAKQSIDPSARFLGFKFLREHGPKSNNQNQFVEWTEEQVSKQSSPIYGWEKPLVKESLRNYAAGKVLAKTISFYPFTLKSLSAMMFSDIVVKILHNLNQRSIIWIGLAGVGKSPASKIIGFLVSKFNIDRDGQAEREPSIRTARNLDFFRGDCHSRCVRKNNCTVTANVSLSESLRSAEDLMPC